MLLKEYFTDGLLQVAIVLSLLRTDFDLYFGTRYQEQWRRTELQEIMHGPHVGYTQTDYHTRTGYQPSHLYSKHIDFIRTEEVLRDLHSLGDYHRLDGVQTNIATWLVNGPEPLVAQAQVGNQNDGDSRVVQSESDSSDQTNQASPSVESAVPNYSAYFGTELTKEDMDLIDILWRQDIDLGIGREVFDSSLRQEKELKEKKINETEVEEHSDIQNVTVNPASTLVNQTNYAVDNETGELIPVTPGVAPSITADDVLEFLQQINNTNQFNQGNDLGSLKNLSDHNDTFDDFFDEYGVQQDFDVQPSIKLEQESTPELLDGVGEGEESWEDVLSLLQEQSLLTEDISTYINTAQSINRQDSMMSLDLLNIAADNQSVDDLAYRNPVLFSEQTNTLNSSDLWNSSLSADDQYLVNNVSLAQTVSMPYTTATLLNTSFTSFSNFSTTPDLSVQTPRGSTSNLTSNLMSPIFSLGQSSAPFTNLTALLTDPSTTYNDSVTDITPQIGGATADLPMLNLSQPVTIAPYNNNDTFIQQLLQNNDLADLTFDDNIDEDTGAALGYDGLHESWSTDSAVSSMHSPPQAHGASSGSSYAGSLDGMEELEGATGGSSKDEIKYSETLRYSAYRDYDMNSRRLHSFSSNTSLSTNSSHHEYDESAKPYQKHVAHNHTYYLQPGQKSREEKEAEARREREERATRCKDAKRAEMLKIPFCVEDIIDLPVDQFTELLSGYTLTEAQHQLIRDIRRRGKNKAAAQNCRKRKLEVIQSLEDEVEGLRVERDKLQQNKMKLSSDTMMMKEKFARLQADILRSLRDPSGRPYNPDEYTLQRTSDGDIILVPRSRASTNGARRPNESLPEEREHQKRKPKRKE